MATVRCGKCGAEVQLPETSSFAMGMTISNESKGNYTLPMRDDKGRFVKKTTTEYGTDNVNEKENTNMMMNNNNGANNNTNKEMNGMNMNGFDMEMLAKMVAGMIGGQAQATQNTTENDVQNVNAETTYNTVADGGQWAKGSKYYGKEICGFIFNPYMIRWHLQKDFEQYMKDYRNNVNYAITKEVPYMKSITYTLEEVRKLAMLQKKDRLAYDERRRCFDINSCKKIFADYIRNVIKVVKNYEMEVIKNNKVGATVRMGLKKYGWFDAGIVAEKVENHKVVKYLARTMELESVYTELNRILHKLEERYGIYNYKDLYDFMRDNIAIKVPADTTKSKAFMNVYIKSGAYYTLKQTLMFHENIAFRGLYGRAAIDELRKELNKEHTEGYMIYAMLKEVKGIR